MLGLLAQDNGLAIVMELIIITLLAGNYKYLRIIYNVTSEYYYKLLIDNCNGILYHTTFNIEISFIEFSFLGKNHKPVITYSHNSK